MCIPQMHAQTTVGPITIGAGLRTDYTHTEPSGGTSLDQFSLDSIRLYVSGSVTDHIKVMFNTEYDQGTNKIEVLDAVGEYSASPKFNIWFGRFLPPSDRANLYGPYYANEWAVYTDGIQDGYPFVFDGRDNGVMYWGQTYKEAQGLGGSIRWRLGDRQSDGAGRSQSAARLLGSGRRVLPEWNLLRRQESAGNRRSHAVSVREDGNDGLISCSIRN